MRIALAQINSTIGDFSGNSKMILDFVQKAKNRADLILFPELALPGFPPLDLLEEEHFIEGNIRTLDALIQELPESPAVGLGFISRNPHSQNKKLLNTYGVILHNELVFQQGKTLLPCYDFFDESRYFYAAEKHSVFEFKGERIGFAIGEDMWHRIDAPGTFYETDPIREILDQGAAILCTASASPYVRGNHKARQELAEQISLKAKIPLICVNAAGANDSLIMEGRSFALNPVAGNTVSISHAKAFDEDLIFWDSTDSQGTQTNENTGVYQCELDELEDALVLGIRDYMKKCGFIRAHLGLSGGIDSALAAYLAVRAAGKENVCGIGMPSRFSSRGSKDDAEDLAKNLGCRYEVVPIEPIYSAYLSALEGIFENRPFDLAEENLQARIRGVLLMAFSNKFNSMLLATGNKSELAMGYCTLYGDTNGALAPIGDVFKTDIFALCNRINERSMAENGKVIIPLATIDKPPSAELRPNQKDEDSLPPYEVLDEILKLILYENLTVDEIVKKGRDRELTEKIIRTMARSEFKRRQTPMILKVSKYTFGTGKRIPLARALQNQT